MLKSDDFETIEIFYLITERAYLALSFKLLSVLPVCYAHESA